MQGVKIQLIHLRLQGSHIISQEVPGGMRVGHPPIVTLPLVDPNQGDDSLSLSGTDFPWSSFLLQPERLHFNVSLYKPVVYYQRFSFLLIFANDPDPCNTSCIMKFMKSTCGSSSLRLFQKKILEREKC